MIKNEYRISKFLTLEFVCHMWQIDTHSYFFLGDKRGQAYHMWSMDIHSYFFLGNKLGQPCHMSICVDGEVGVNCTAKHPEHLREPSRDSPIPMVHCPQMMDHYLVLGYEAFALDEQ